MKLVTDINTYELVEIEYPHFVYYKTSLPVEDFPHFLYNKAWDNYTYKSLIINGKFYGVKIL